VIGTRRRGTEGTSVLRARLIASILVAALLPFLTAWWIANTYVKQQAKSNAETRLAFNAGFAAREASALLVTTRRRALALASDPALQRAAFDRNRKALRRLLRPGETVVLPARASAPATRVGRPLAGIPAVSVVVNSGGRRLATVAVSAPTAGTILKRARAAALTGTPDVLALVRGGVVVAGPPALRGGHLGADGRIRVRGDTYRAETVTLPGYRPPAQIAAVADGSYPGDDTGALRDRLAIAALISLFSIVLYAAALARPLLRGLNRVASVAEQAMIDPLTAASNRRGFERALRIELARSVRRGHPLALVVTDLDDFKLVNDLHGHGVGDDVLVTLAERLQEAVRSADTVARLGGEEFALLLPETDLAGALAVAERARAAFEEGGVRLKNGSSLNVTASFGVADFPASRDGDALMQDADNALYSAKRLGKNRVVAAARAAAAA
jgi:diguanylate cyclase (GGDEF)-like protein